MWRTRVSTLLAQQEAVPYTIRDIPGGGDDRIEYMDYSLPIYSKHRCWRCRVLFEKVYVCGKCKHVAYCSKECQSEDWKEHRPRCRIASTYDLSRGAVLRVRKTPPQTGEYMRVLKTALILVTREHIHPDAIRMNTSANYDAWEDYESVFDISYEISPGALLFFLEYGLSPQQVINHELFIAFNIHAEKSADILLEYGKGKLIFPLQKGPCAVGWLYKRGVDIHTIFSPESWYHSLYNVPEEVRFLASTGFDFTKSAHGDERTILDIIDNYDNNLAEDIRDILSSRPRIIREALEEVCIPVLACIILAYLNILPIGK